MRGVGRSDRQGFSGAGQVLGSPVAAQAWGLPVSVRVDRAAAVAAAGSGSVPTGITGVTEKPKVHDTPSVSGQGVSKGPSRPVGETGSGAGASSAAAAAAEARVDGVNLTLAGTCPDRSVKH